MKKKIKLNEEGFPMSKTSYSSKVEYDKDLSPKEVIVREALATFNAGLAFFSDPDHENKLKITAFHGENEELLEKYEEHYMDTVEHWVFESRAPMIIPDSGRDPRFLVKMQNFPPSAILSFPVFANENIGGIISIHKKVDGGIGSDSIKQIQNFARWAGKLLESNRQEEQNRIQQNKLSILNWITRSITSIHRVDEAVSLITGTLKNSLKTVDCRLVSFKDEKDREKLSKDILRIVNRGKTDILSHTDHQFRVISPVEFNRQKIGYLDITGEEMNQYMDMLGTISALAGAAMARIVLSTEIGLKRKEFEAMEAIAEYELSGQLISSNELSRILDSTLQILVNLLNVERVNIMLYDPDTKELRVQAYWGVDEEPFGVEILKDGEGVAGHALRIGKPYQKTKSEDPIFIDSPNSQMEINSIFAFPMIVEGRKVGVINIGTIYKDRVFSDHEIKMVSIISTRTALAIENSRLIRNHESLAKDLEEKKLEVKKKTLELADRGKRLSSVNQSLKKSLARLKDNNRLQDLMNQLTLEIAESQNIDFILNRSLEIILKALARPMRIAAFSIINDNDGRFEVAAQRGVAPRYMPLLQVSPDELPPVISKNVFKEKIPFICHRTSDHPEFDPRDFKGINSIYIFPLNNEEYVFGALVLASSKEKDATEHELEMITTITKEISLALNHIRNRDELKNRIDKLAKLNKMSIEIDYAQDMQKWVKEIARYACELIGHRFSLFFLYDQWGQLQLKSSFNGEFLYRQIADPDIKMVIEEVVSRNIIYYSSSDYEEQLKRYSLLNRFGVKSLVILPLQIKDQKIGAVVLGDENQKIHSKEALEFYKLLSTRLALIINNITLFSRILLETDRAKSVIESISEGVVSIDWERNITAFNKAAEIMTGWSAGELLGKPCHSIFACNNEAKNGKCLDSCPLLNILSIKEQDKGLRSEGHLVTRDGRKREIALTISLLTQNNDPVGGVMVFRDITEEKAYQARRADYLAALSHDIFTPLTAIKGYTTTLLTHREKFDIDTQEEFIKVINSEIDRITRLLYNLMSLSRMETDKLQANPFPQKMDAIVEKIIDLYSISTRNHKIIQDESVKGVPQVFADSDHIEQILNNLVSNAIKYSPGGGDIIISALHEGDKVRVIVRDHGIGIDENNLEKIFDRYHRVITKESRSVSGMGLGLFITKALVEMQGGEIWAEHCENGGSRFIFTLPVFDGEERRKDVRKVINS